MIPGSSPSSSPSSSKMFYEGLSKGELYFSRCSACGQKRLPPRVRCDVCGNTELAYKPLENLAGRLVAVTVIRFPPKGFESEAPYSIGIVELNEGLRTMCRVQKSGDGSYPSVGSTGKIEVNRERQSIVFRASAP
ncbi:MAG: OB-fold domain-containing protein [Thermoprotei archaeon]